LPYIPTGALLRQREVTGLNSATLISLGLVILIGSLLAGAADLALVEGTSATSGLGNAAHLDAVFRFETFKLKELAVFGYDISYPSVNAGFFKGLSAILMWDFSFLAGQWALLRLPLMALTFSFGILFLVTVAPAVATVMRAILSAASVVAGGVGALVRRLIVGL